jgi:hypothetical protein
MFLLAKYGTQTTFHFPLEIRGAVDLAGNADFTPVVGDVKISKDGAAATNTANVPTCLVAPDIHWQLTLTAPELTSSVSIIQLVDQTVPKAVEDQFILIYTYGNAAAKIGVDLSQTALDANIVQALGQVLLLNGGGGQKIGT